MNFYNKILFFCFFISCGTSGVNRVDEFQKKQDSKEKAVEPFFFDENGPDYISVDNNMLTVIASKITQDGLLILFNERLNYRLDKEKPLPSIRDNNNIMSQTISSKNLKVSLIDLKTNSEISVKKPYVENHGRYGKVYIIDDQNNRIYFDRTIVSINNSSETIGKEYQIGGDYSKTIEVVNNNKKLFQVKKENEVFNKSSLNSFVGFSLEQLGENINDSLREYKLGYSIYCGLSKNKKEGVFLTSLYYSDGDNYSSCLAYLLVGDKITDAKIINSEYKYGGYPGMSCYGLKHVRKFTFIKQNMDVVIYWPENTIYNEEGYNNYELLYKTPYFIFINNETSNYHIKIDKMFFYNKNIRYETTQLEESERVYKFKIDNEGNIVMIRTSDYAYLMYGCDMFYSDWMENLLDEELFSLLFKLKNTRLVYQSYLSSSVIPIVSKGSGLPEYNFGQPNCTHFQICKYLPNGDGFGFKYISSYNKMDPLDLAVGLDDEFYVVSRLKVTNELFSIGEVGSYSQISPKPIKYYDHIEQLDEKTNSPGLTCIYRFDKKHGFLRDNPPFEEYYNVTISEKDKRVKKISLYGPEGNLYEKIYLSLFNNNQLSSTPKENDVLIYDLNGILFIHDLSQGRLLCNSRVVFDNIDSEQKATDIMLRYYLHSRYDDRDVELNYN